MFLKDATKVFIIEQTIPIFTQAENDALEFESEKYSILESHYCQLAQGLIDQD